MENKEKIKALSEYLGEEVKEEGDYFVGEDSGNEYLVLTEEEADDMAKESIKNFLDEFGIEGFSKDFQEEIKNYCLDEEALKEVVKEEIEFVWNNNYSDEDVIDDAIDTGAIQEDEIYDEDGEIRDDVDIDRLREEGAEREFEDRGENPVSFLEDTYGSLKDSGLNIKDYIDEDKVADRCIEWDGRGNSLATYDGDELYLGNDLYAYRVN